MTTTTQTWKHTLTQRPTTTKTTTKTPQNKTNKQNKNDYIYENSEHVVGHGTFLALNPFYVKPAKNMTSKCAAGKASTCKMVH